MNKNNLTVVILILIIIIAAFFRLYNITQAPPGLYPDEAMNGTNAQEAISTGNFKVFYPENNGREGLFINIQALSLMTFGNQPWALRGVSAIFGIFTVLGLYFLTKELFKKWHPENSKKIALLSAFLLAANFWHINFSRIGFRAIMAPFFLTWAVYFILKSFGEEKCKNAVIAGIFYGLGFYSYIAFRATPLIIAVIFGYWLVKYPGLKKNIIKNFIVLTVVSLVVFAPLGYYFAKHPADFFGRTTQVSVFSSPAPVKDLSLNIIKTAGMFNFSGDQNWRHNYSGNPELFWPVGIMFLVGIFFGVYFLFKKIKFFGEENFPFLILFSWLVVAALPVVISNEGIPHALRSILMIPPVIILAGFGGVLIYNRLKEILKNKKLILFIIRYSLFIILIIFAYKNYFIDWAHNQNTDGAFAKNYVDMGMQLNSLPKELPKYVIVEANGADVRGLPMPTQTIMFITDTFTSEKQKEKNIFYVLPKDISKIPQNAFTVELK